MFVLWTISMVFFCVGMSGAGLTAGDAFAYLGGWFTGWSPARFGAELYGAAYNGFYANTIMVAAYYAFVVVTLALGFALDARRAFTYKNKPSEICLANEKHRWGILLRISNLFAGRLYHAKRRLWRGIRVWHVCKLLTRFARKEGVHRLWLRHAPAPLLWIHPVAKKAHFRA